MLPADRQSRRVIAGQLVPDYLTAVDHPWLRDLIDVLRANEGRPRGELDRRLREPLPHPAPRKKLRMASHVLLGLLRTREPDLPVEPRRAREILFLEAAAARLSGGPWTPATARVAAARRLEVDEAALDASLLADLPSEREIVLPEALPGPDELALRTNLGLVQGLLRRAVSLRLTLHGNTRDLVRHARLQGLLCVARPVPDGVELELSGPVALFRRTTLYGRAQASLVPRLRWCERFRLEARCVVPEGEAVLRLGPEDPLYPTPPPRRFDSQVEEAFARDLARRFPEWDLVREPEPLEAGGALVFPDFALARRSLPGVRWLVEIVGFWTPDYLRAKLERLRNSGARGLVLCIDETLNCAEAEAPADMPMVRYRRRVDPAAVIEATRAWPEGTVLPGLLRTPLEPGAYFLDWAGRRPEGDPVHGLLGSLAPGARVWLVARDGWCLVVDRDGRPLAALSGRSRDFWAGRLSAVAEVRVRALLERRREQSGAAYRDRLRVDRWRVPLVDVTWRSEEARQTGS